MAHGFGGPGGGFVGVTGSAGVGHFVFVGHRRGDESEGVRADFGIANFRSNFRHVAGNATAAGRILLVMCMFFNRAGARAVKRKWAVAIHTNLVGGLLQLGVIPGAVDIVTGGTRDAASVHQALHEIIALHTILVGGAVCVVREGGFAEGVLFQLPVIAQA